MILWEQLTAASSSVILTGRKSPRLKISERITLWDPSSPARRATDVQFVFIIITRSLLNDVDHVVCHQSVVVQSDCTLEWLTLLEFDAVATIRFLRVVEVV